MNRRTVIGFALGPLGAAALSFVSLPLMTWIFPPEAIGKLSMLQVTIQLSVLLFCLGLDQAYGREYHESSNRQELLLNAMIPGLLLMIFVLSGIFIISPVALSRLLYGDASAATSLITVGCIVVAYVSRFLSLILRMQDRGLAFSLSQLLSKLLLLGIVSSYLLLPITRTFIPLLLAQAAALTLTLLVFCWNTRRDWLLALRARVDGAMSRKLLSFGWPLVFGGVASWGLAALDRIFLRSMAGYDQLAIYSVAASIASGVTVFAGVFNIIWAPLVFKWVADKMDTRRVDVIAQQVSIVVLILVCLAGGCSWILHYILPAVYREVAYLVPGCMVAPMLYTLSEVTGIGIAISRRTRFALLASFGAVLLNIGLCYLLVPRWGAAGAMAATACSFWVFFILRTEFSAFAWRKIKRTKIHLYCILALVLSITYGEVGSVMPREIVFVWWALLVLIAYLNRSSLRNLMNTVKLSH